MVEALCDIALRYDTNAITGFSIAFIAQERISGQFTFDSRYLPQGELKKIMQELESGGFAPKQLTPKQFEDWIVQGMFFSTQFLISITKEMSEQPREILRSLGVI